MSLVGSTTATLRARTIGGAACLSDSERVCSAFVQSIAYVSVRAQRVSGETIAMARMLLVLGVQVVVRKRQLGAKRNDPSQAVCVAQTLTARVYNTRTLFECIYKYRLCISKILVFTMV